MKHAVVPFGMGTAMGTMFGWMAISGALVGVGLGFIAAHVVVIAALLLASLFFPAVRNHVRAHLSDPRMLKGMGYGMAAGFVFGVGLHITTSGAA